MTQNYDHILKVLQQLQEGYNRRDPKYIDEFMRIFSKDDVFLIIGTNPQEVIRSFEAAKQLFLDDWENWGEVVFDIKNAVITSMEKIAWVFMNGTNTDVLTSEYIDKCLLKWENSSLDEKTPRKKEKFLEILNFHEANLKEHPDGELFESPIRVTIILVKEKDLWSIQHMHFSFPIKGYQLLIMKKIQLLFSILEEEGKKSG